MQLLVTAHNVWQDNNYFDASIKDASGVTTINSQFVMTVILADARETCQKGPPLD